MNDAIQNKISELENNNPIKLLQDLMHLKESCCSKIVFPGTKITNDIVIENHLTPNPYLGYQFEIKTNKSNLSGEDEKKIHNHCINFLLLFIKQLHQRLPDNISILQISSLSIDHCHNPIKKDILSLAKMFFFNDDVLTFNGGSSTQYSGKRILEL